MRVVIVAALTLAVGLLSLAACRRGQIAPGGSPTPQATAAQEPTGAPYTVGVYYYPWYGDDFHGGQYLREHLVPVQTPSLGEYDDRDEDVIAQHLACSRYAGIGLWVTSWWGPGGREDTTTLGRILPHPELGDLKIALFYETTGRTKDFTDLTQVESDIAYLAEHYFAHPNYLKIDGKPVLFVYLTRVLSRQGMLEDTLEGMRRAGAEAGFDLFIIGDQVFGAAPGVPGSLALLDGVTNYDVYGSMGARGYATQATVDGYYRVQARWKALAEGAGVAFVPAVTPGFNDRGVREGHAPVSRKLGGPDATFGSLFEAMLRGALPLADPAAGHMVMVTSWNEWHEDTQIEPVTAAPETSLDDSETGSAYTDRLAYEGYGERYLRILRDAVFAAPGTGQAGE